MLVADRYAHGTLSRYTRGKCRCDKCRAANRAYQQQWAAANKDKTRAASRRWIAGHRDQAKRRTAAWRAANPDRAAEMSRRWSRDNPEQHALIQHRRRARMRSAGVFLVTARDWRRLCHRYDERCAYCGQRRPLTQDHVIPIVRGGRHSIGNLVPACKPCNSSKGPRLLIEWRVVREPC